MHFSMKLISEQRTGFLLNEKLKYLPEVIGSKKYFFKIIK